VTRVCAGFTVSCVSRETLVVHGVNTVAEASWRDEDKLIGAVFRDHFA